MNNVEIEATERSPSVSFDFSTNRFSISGESYPEDVTAFYGDIIQKLEDHFDALESGDVEFHFELIYFNSSTAKVLMGLFETLDECAESGANVRIVWRYEEEDDNMQELGEEFAEDLEHASFALVEVPIT